MKRYRGTVAALIFFFIVIGGIIFADKMVEKYMPSDEQADLEAYYNLEADDEAAVLLNFELLDTKALRDGEVLYLDAEMVREYLNDGFYWDKNENILTYTTPTEVIRVDVGSRDYYVNKAKQTENAVIVKADGERAYISVDFIKKYTNLQYDFFEEPARLRIMTQWGAYRTATVKKDAVLRVGDGVKQAQIRVLKGGQKGGWLYVLEKGKKWSKVETGDGMLGYIQNKYLEFGEVALTEPVFIEPDMTNITKDYKINMVWHQITEKSDNDKVLSMLADTKGVNTVSPTWFSVSDNEGNISSLASQSYVNYAKQLGMEVWALVDNFKEGVDISQVLSCTSKRDRLVNQLMAAAIEYQLDGINVDFEKLPDTSGKDFIQFIRELSVKCRNNGIVLSIDNYVPQDYNLFYDRAEQGEWADYIIIMGYDEHYNGSETSGSVASIGFVRDGIARTLEEVPAEKVINGIPFYTRIWKEADGTVTSEAVGMDTADKRLSVNGAEKNWDETTAQYYSEYEKDGAVYKVWLEEERSIGEKMKLVKENNLAGVSAWKLGFERKTIWDTIIKYVN